MTQTSEERNAVAARLRDGGIARNVKEAYTLILSCVGIRPQLPAETTYTDAMARLADLIDPTCKPVVDDVHGMDDELVCSECGCFLAIVVDGKPSEPLYRYCPVCGARVVSDDE
ncbi:hypothetical protein [Atopobium fossor]|uniref:hypothetical protein n=1 Tax=Atopobium fossor TaxID=39487 RepID=UPI0005566EA0|nr:hypothetical protein [Atopobium fossor]